MYADFMYADALVNVTHRVKLCMFVCVFVCVPRVYSMPVCMCSSVCVCVMRARLSSSFIYARACVWCLNVFECVYLCVRVNVRCVAFYRIGYVLRARA